MKKLQLIFALVLLTGLFSCDQTNKKDNATHDPDTMVLKRDRTDTATTTVSTDTTKR
jgi:hypothetical protein